MPNDINELDVTDAGLKGIFGDRFHDETQSEPKKVISKKETTTTTKKKTAQKPKEKPVDASLCPAKPALDWMDKLKCIATWVIGFGGLNFLIFYWQLAGLMDESIAITCMWVCMALVGIGIGKNLKGGSLMPYYSLNPVADFHSYDRELERMLNRLPVCDNPRCKCRIQDDYYFEIEGEILCEDCMNERYRKRTEDYNA